MLLADQERVARSSGLQDAISVVQQNGSRGSAHLLIILDQQDGLRAPTRGRGGRRGCRQDVILWPGAARQVDPERRASSDLTLDRDMPTTLANDAEHRRE